VSKKKFPYIIRESWSGAEKGVSAARFRYPADARIFAVYMNSQHSPEQESFTVWYRGKLLSDLKEE
jgi:hypothetical protein